MTRFEEPQKEDVKIREAGPQLSSESNSESKSTSDKSTSESTSMTTLATQPAQLAITRSQSADRSAPKEEEPDGGSVSDLLSLAKPLLWLLLLLSLPWIFGSTMMDWTIFERMRAGSMADSALNGGRLADAESWTKVALEAIPREANNVNDGRHVYSLTRLGQIHSQMGKFAIACGDFAAAYEYAHKNSAALDYGNLAALLPEYVAALNSNGRADLAVKMEEEAAKIPMNNFEADNYQYMWRELANAYNNVGRYDAALKATNKANASTTDSWNRIRIDTVAGDALEGLGRHRDAQSRYITAYNSGIDRSGQYVSDYLRGGGVYLTGLADKQNQNAKVWLDDALKMARQYPGNARYDEAAILNDLANWYMTEHQPMLAIQSLEQAKLLDGKKVDPWLSLRKYANRDKLTGDWLSRKDPNFPQTEVFDSNLDYARDLYNLALAKIAVADVGGAKTALGACIEIRTKLLGTNNPLTQKAINALNHGL